MKKQQPKMLSPKPPALPKGNNPYAVHMARRDIKNRQVKK